MNTTGTVTPKLEKCKASQQMQPKQFLRNCKIATIKALLISAGINQIPLGLRGAFIVTNTMEECYQFVDFV